MSMELDGAVEGLGADGGTEPADPMGRVDAAGKLCLEDEPVVSAWCQRYGVTRDQLTIATRMVGHMPAALHFYLTSRGRPTKIITDEMRAARAPVRPRDRRRKEST